MALLHYIDNEVPWGEGAPPAHYGEWDSRVQAGSSTVTRTTDASFPERGSYGLTVSVVSSGDCYMRKDLAAETSPLAFGFWLYIPSAPTWSSGNYVELNRGKNATNGTNSWVIHLYNDGGAIRLRIFAYAAGAQANAVGGTLVTGRWYYVALIGEWTAIHAYAQLYLDGVSVATAEKVADATTNKPEYVQLGSDWSTGTEATYYVDEAKIRDDWTYPEPYVPTASSDYPCPERTMVLWRGASDDSRQFADYCVSQLGIPRCNLLRLDTAAADETLADYATFQAQIGNCIAPYLVNHPSVAANVRCFLLGYGVPGYFTHAGVKHSATSRLMNYGTVFSSGTANPLYNPDPVVRLGSGDLGGKYLATRIDADTLQHAKDIVDAGLAFFETALAELTDTDTLYSDDATYLASLNRQHLRILTSALGTYADDAFVFGDTGTPAFGTAGSRACFTDDSAGSADTLRANSSPCGKALIDAGYAAALGSSETADTFDADSFFEMLRIGGTLAEAFAVAIAKLDYTSVAVGVPFMTAAFQQGGYNIYRGVGGADSIDYAQAVAHARAGVDEADLVGLGHVADVDYYYGVRAVSDAGVEEANTTRCVRAQVTAGGELVGPPPNRILSARASPVAAGKVWLDCFYSATAEAGKATAIQVALEAPDGQADWGSLVDTIAIPGTWRIRQALSPTFDHGQRVRLHLRAVTAAGTPGPVLRVPAVTADAVGPPAVDYVEAEQA